MKIISNTLTHITLFAAFILWAFILIVIGMFQGIACGFMEALRDYEFHKTRAGWFDE